MPCVISTENLEFSYGATPVLRGVDLSIRAGEVVCLLGPNGVGKTTLVENLLGSLTPGAGTVEVLGTDPRRAGARFWSRVGLVQQNWSDHAKWRVADQLEWVRAMHATTVRASELLSVPEALEAVGLADKATTRLSRLSGGQRRSIDMAAALIARPEVLILDEPTTGLDPVSKSRLHEVILDRVDDAGAVLMTTHDLAEAERIASRVLIMSQGRILADGTVTELREGLAHDAEVTWSQDGERHVHSTSDPERFVSALDLETISDLTITRPTLEETYLALVRKEES
ncbi:ABC transporter ATP-binding protein [Actinomyces slackii]|uniref:Fluoroquinolones export ATP-binding protein Rv2688c/MT2762 n=1 Tax=Actinomyces slackii TaxID=52774 RepID=A0A448KDL2_9ACTO|nr:ABC transporter ATP-binding protein [Actinomyces slackii]VEG75013.1 Fluoroquinolones export ATP-binding protein Rv2688c/MT2762 [Actinomyces slackii]